MKDRRDEYWWYTRRDGVVRGPYHPQRVSRYILLGRIRESDELSMDKRNWFPVHALPGRAPEEMHGTSSGQDYERLLLSFRNADERYRPDRRTAGVTVSDAHMDRRSGAERRSGPPEHLLRHGPGGRRGAGGAAPKPVTEFGRCVLWGAAATLLIVMLMAYLP
jgi:hypothetical protein